MIHVRVQRSCLVLASWPLDGQVVAREVNVAPDADGKATILLKGFAIDRGGTITLD